jgi:flagella basal body P-ring formation protein FlgA
MIILVRVLFIAVLTAVVRVSMIGAQEPVIGGPVAARRINRGAVITAEDVSGQVAPVDGWIARRVIQPGEALGAPAVSPPPLVRSRQDVTVLVSRGTITLSIPGSALVDASLGDTILVRLDARRRVRAVVSGPGRVTATVPSSR